MQTTEEEASRKQVADNYCKQWLEVVDRNFLECSVDITELDLEEDIVPEDNPVLVEDTDSDTALAGSLSEDNQGVALVLGDRSDQVFQAVEGLVADGIHLVEPAVVVAAAAVGDYNYSFVVVQKVAAAVVVGLESAAMAEDLRVLVADY